MDRQDAIKAINRGAIAACFAASLMLIGTVTALTAIAKGGPNKFDIDIWSLLDVGLIAIFAYFIWRKSRLAVVSMFLYYLISVIFEVANGEIASLVIGVILMWFFVRAIKATFIWHKLEKMENPDYRPTRKWVMGLGGITATLLSIFLVYGFAESYGYFPAFTVETGQEMPARQRAKLRKKSIVKDNEAIRYYFAVDNFDMTYAGSVLTEKRVIQYWKYENTVDTFSLDVQDINEIEVISEGGDLENAVYAVFSADEEKEYVVLTLSIENNRHLEMISAIEKHITENQARLAASEE